MSSILYYSNFCDHSKKIIQVLSKSKINKDIHFICIDKRISENNETYIILENGQKIILPKTVNCVPALLLFNENYKILYGNSILEYLKPKEEIETQKATNNNFEPLNFSFGNAISSSNIVSDNYSFLDMEPDDLSAQGNGGLRQTHNYVTLQYENRIYTPEDETDYKTKNKIPSDLTLEKLQESREKEFNNMGPGLTR
jgi:hypothetical protein